MSTPETAIVFNEKALESFTKEFNLMDEERNIEKLLISPN